MHSDQTGHSAGLRWNLKLLSNRVTPRLGQSFAGFSNVGSSIIIAQEVGLRQIEDIYSRRQEPAYVRRFLRLYPQLIDVLLEAPSPIDRHFGPDAPLLLEVVRDPEIEDADKAFIYILTSFPPDEALSRLDELDRQWWLDQLHRVCGRLNINLAFV